MWPITNLIVAKLCPMKNLVTFLALALLLGCSSDDAANSLSRIEILSSNGVRLDISETTTLSANGYDQADATFTITDLQWSSNNSNVSVDQNGLITGLIVGTSTITAQSGSVTANIEITVWDSSAPRTEIYVSDAGANNQPPFQIVKYDEDGSNPEVFISQNLAWPQDILFLEDQGVVLVSNLNSGLIGRYDANDGSFISNFATGIGGPTRTKIGPDNLLYVLQWQGNGKVLRYQLDGTFVDEFTSVGVSESIGLDWDSDGNLYVSSFNNGAGGSVRKFDTMGQDQGLFIDSNIQGPTNIWFDDNGNLLVNDWSGAGIKRFGSDGSFTDTFIRALNRPEGIDFLLNGNFLIGNGGTAAIKMYDASGTFIRDLVTSGSGGLLNPNAVRVRNLNQ